MKLPVEQFKRRLKNLTERFLLFHGDEPYFINEALNVLSAHVRAEGYDVVSLVVDSHFNWRQFYSDWQSIDLFAPKRLWSLDLQIKPTTEAREIFKHCLDQPTTDTMVAVNAGYLESSARSGRWFRQIVDKGLVVESWHLAHERFCHWLEKRASKLRLNPDALALLVRLTDGNPGMAVQELDKLALLSGGAMIDRETLQQAVGDQARYRLFDLVDAVLAGERNRAVRMLYLMREEGVEPILIAWALHQEVRFLASGAFCRQRGGHPEQSPLWQGLWNKRRQALSRALAGLSPTHCRQALGICLAIELIIKGQRSGDPWEKLSQLVILLATDYTSTRQS